MSRSYTITLNETQAGTIQIACEVLARRHEVHRSPYWLCQAHHLAPLMPR